MASIVATNAFQALALETESRRVSNAQKCCSSFVGDISQLALSSCKMRPVQWSRSLNALCVRMDSRFTDETWKRPAVALPDYAIADSDFDTSSLTKGFARDLDEPSLPVGSSESENSGRLVSSLGLRPELVDALHKRGITHLFPIQEAVLKPALEGMDIIARARTGTGKTLAFGIPIIQSLIEKNEQNNSRRRNRNPGVLVLAPTRELAMQVEKEFMESAPNLSTLCVYGGVSIVGQQRKLQKGVDIAVGTPGRVMDLIERGSLELSEISYLVLDEADQMLAVGFEEDVEKILEHVPDNRQSMLFSATMPAWVLKLARKYLKSPLKIDLVGDSKEKLAQGIKMLSIASPASAKRSILSDLITVYGKGGKTIVFTQTKRDADEVALSMNRMLGTEALHGDISQAQREKTLAAFREGRFSVLVATDVAARGLDIPNVDLVIHYEIPNDPETFVHRSGRTGRAGKDGTTILIYSDSQKRTIRMIERDVGCKFQSISAPTSHDVLQASSEQARDALRKVHPELRSVFLPTAKTLLEEQGVDALAAAIAHLSGFTQPPASRSLITHQQGWMTLQFTRDQTWGRGGLSSPGGIMGALGSIYPKAADEVGKIIMLDPSVGMGAVFDLPEDVATELLQLELSQEDSIQAISQLPLLQYDDAPRDRYGRFPQRGGRTRGREQNDSPSWGSRGSRSSNMGMRKGQQQWSPPPRRAPQGNDGFQRFSQKCFICGEAGHRAAVCPSR